MVVDETGRDWMLLSDGIVRARYRQGRHKTCLLTPGRVERYRIDLWHVALTIQPGQCLALAVSSSNFPRFSRNLNTGGDNERDTHFQVAEQTLLHNKNYPSHLEVPVVD